MAAIFGICRQSEIAKTLVQDVQIEEDRGVIRLRGRRTKGGVLVQWHEIHSGEGYDVVNIFKSYIKRSGCELGGPNGRFFLNVHGTNGCFYKSPSGKNMWTTVAKEIVKFLGYENYET